MHVLLLAASALTVFHAHAANPFATKPFTDVSTNHVNAEAIEYLRKNNVIRGYEDGTFKPENRINRAEFLHLVTNPFLLNTRRLSDCIREEIQSTETHYIFYTDVPRDAWFGPAVCLATIQSIINGYPDKTFRPGNYISFVEAAKIISRIFSFQVQEESGDTWYVPYVEKLSDRQAIPTSVSSLGETITRGEMAEILYRLKAHVTTKQSRTAGALKP